MEWIIGWLVLSILAGIIAGNRGRSWWGFFFLALLLSPLIGIIAALVVQPGTANLEQAQLNSGETKRCPHCAELIKMEAVVCRYCGRDLPHRPPAWITNAPQPDAVERLKDGAPIFAPLPDEAHGTRVKRD